MFPDIRGSSWEKRNELRLSPEEIPVKESLLQLLGFVFLPRGRVRLGTKYPLPCRFEGHRINEAPVREIEIAPFWICKFTVTNREFELFNPKRVRPQTSLLDTQPVTNVTYLNALRYAEFLSDKYNLAFSLPTEPEWVYAAAPFGWEYPYHQDRNPNPKKTHNFILEESDYQTLDVDDPRHDPNIWGLYHIGGNVQEFTLGSYYTGSGAWGYLTDGRYCIVKGGDFGHCPLSSGVHRRGISDVSARSERVGIRLAHQDLKYYATT